MKGGSRMRTVSDLVELEVRAQEKSVGLFSDSVDRFANQSDFSSVKHQAAGERMSESDAIESGEAGFSHAQLAAISAVVERVLDKALSKRGEDKACGSGPSTSGTAEVPGRRSLPPGSSEPGSSSGTAPGE